MGKTIIQEVSFKNTTTKILYDLYMNEKLHGMIVNGKVTISEKAGSKMEAFNGYITGKTLIAIQNEMVAQMWRGSDWEKSESDSVFILTFEQRGKNVTLNVIHANVPDEQAPHLDKGWYDHYWNPWKQYLAGEPITRPEN